MLTPVSPNPAHRSLILGTRESLSFGGNADLTKMVAVSFHMLPPDADLARCCAGHHSYSTYYASDGSFAPVATNADVVQTVSASNADPETAIVFHHFSYAHCDTDFGVY